MNAFIIGNGFDLAHDLPTSYSDFHSYIFERFPNLNTHYMYVPATVIGHHGETVVSEEDTASLLCYLLNDVCGDDWKDFENALGKIDLFECFNDLERVYDRDGDRNLWHEAYNNEDRTTDLSCAIPMIKVFFSDWIKSIQPANKKIKGFSEIIDSENDLFITFNYTHTLEELYGCKKVVHMHGEVGKEIIIGHNGTKDYTEENPSTPIGCYNSLQGIYDGLRKNTDEVIRRHYDEIKSIADCEKIYSYGFSYSNVDIPYIKMICESIKSSNVSWLFNAYDCNRIDYYKETVSKNGFCGKFSKYTV